MSGFPVVEATTKYEGQGYRALMGWLQVVRYTSPDDGDVFIVDTAPQFRGITGMDFPFLSWGARESAEAWAEIRDRVQHLHPGWTLQ